MNADLIHHSSFIHLYFPQMIIDGSALAAKANQDVQQRVGAVRSDGRNVALSAILVGFDTGGEVYAQRQGEACRAVGIDYSLAKFAPPMPPWPRWAQAIHSLNNDAAVTASCCTCRCRPTWTPPRCNTRFIPSKTSRA